MVAVLIEEEGAGGTSWQSSSRATTQHPRSCHRDAGHLGWHPAAPFSACEGKGPLPSCAMPNPGNMLERLEVCSQDLEAAPRLLLLQCPPALAAARLTAAPLPAAAGALLLKQALGKQQEKEAGAGFEQKKNLQLLSC